MTGKKMTCTRQAKVLREECGIQTAISDRHFEPRPAATLGGRRNFQHVAIFGDGATGQLDTLFRYHPGNGIIAIGPASRSPAMIASIMLRTAAAALLSPSSVASDTLNSDFSGKQPFGVASSRPLVTRLTVLSCMPTASATSLSASGIARTAPRSGNQPAGG